MIVSIFDKKDVPQNESEKPINLVWANTGFGGAVSKTPNYFKVMALTDGAALLSVRNQRKLKRTMLGNMIWDNLASNF
eukprot:1901834-Ditylum_brightwellii.AAC.2